MDMTMDNRQWTFKKEDLLERILDFGVRIVKLANTLPKTPAGFKIGSQIVGSATSIGANTQEAQDASSKPDFISKMSIALREAKESKFWLKLIKKAGLLPDEQINPELEEADELCAIYSTIVKKAKLNLSNVKSQMSNAKGFTLIELLVVISIIAILSTIGIATYQGVQTKARDSVRKNDLIKLSAALEIYNQQHNGSYIRTVNPNALEDCRRDTGTFYDDLVIKSLMDNNVPKDPSGTDYCYIAVNGGKSYRLFAKLENCSGSSGNLCSSTNFNYSITSPDLSIAATFSPPDVVPTPTPSPTSPPTVPTITNLSANLLSNSATFSFDASGFSVYNFNYIVDISTSPTMSSDTWFTFAQGPYNTLSNTDPKKWGSYTCGQTVYWRVYTYISTGNVTSPTKQSTVTCPTPTPTPSPTPSPSTQPAAIFHYAFVTSQAYDGNLVQRASDLGLAPTDGLDAADKLCKYLADRSTNTNVRGKSWKAWLSDSTNSPSTRFNQSTIPYQLVNGTTVVANNWTDLTDGSIQNRININESGVVNIAAQTVWTVTDQTGAKETFDKPSLACDNWSNSTNRYLANGMGDNSYTDSKWTANGWLQYTCNQQAYLYCFEQ